VVLMGDRGAEERHDAITHDLIDGAFVKVNRLHHLLDDWIEKALRIFRIPGCNQLRGPLQVGEEHRHMLTLAFESGARF
jgi:hypothetical protein